MLKLYLAPGACSLAPHIALEEAGAKYETVVVNLKEGQQRTPDYLSKNPVGRVPALETEQGFIIENPAVLSYIAQAHPQAKLAPSDPVKFAQMQGFNCFLSSTLHAAFSHFNRPGRYADGEAAHEAMKAKVPESLTEYFGIVEARLADGREWVHGEFSVSDPYVYVFARWQGLLNLVDNNLIPKLLAHRDRMDQRPAVRKVLADEGLT